MSNFHKLGNISSLNIQATSPEATQQLEVILSFMKNIFHQHSNPLNPLEVEHHSKELAYSKKKILFSQDFHFIDNINNFFIVL